MSSSGGGHDGMMVDAANDSLNEDDDVDVTSLSEELANSW